MSIAQKILSERGARIEFIVLRNQDGVENFFYLLIKESEYQKMQLEANAGRDIEPSKYGAILLQGRGSNSIKEVDELLEKLIKEQLN